LRVRGLAPVKLRPDLAPAVRRGQFIGQDGPPPPFQPLDRGVVGGIVAVAENDVPGSGGSRKAPRHAVADRGRLRQTADRRAGIVGPLCNPALQMDDEDRQVSRGSADDDFQETPLHPFRSTGVRKWEIRVPNDAFEGQSGQKRHVPARILGLDKGRLGIVEALRPQVASQFLQIRGAAHFLQREDVRAEPVDHPPKGPFFVLRLGIEAAESVSGHPAHGAIVLNVVGRHRDRFRPGRQNRPGQGGRHADKATAVRIFAQTER
jgi:hypothetical protein